MTQNAQTKMTDEVITTVESPPDPGQADEREVLRQALQDERDQYLRLAAEYKNYRSRSKREASEAAEKGKHELLVELVSLADDLDLALAGLNESEGAVADGIRMIHRRFHGILRANSVVAFESVGESFDPERHEAFAVVPAEEGGEGLVQEEMRRGYLWKDKLFRPAMVVVGK